MPHDDPLRLRVLKAITSALREITVANGYKHDLGPSTDWENGSVFRGRVIFGEGDPLPMISILETPVPMDQKDSGQENPSTYGPWEIIVQGFAEDDHLNPTDPAHILMADVRKRLAMEKRNMTKGEAFGIPEINGIDFSPGVVRPPDEASSKAYFWMSMYIKLVEDSTDPYA